MFCKTLIFGKIKKIGELVTERDQLTLRFILFSPSGLSSNSLNSDHQHEVIVFKKAATFVKNCCRVGDVVLVDGENVYINDNGKKKYIVYGRHVNLFNPAELGFKKLTKGDSAHHKKSQWDDMQPLHNTNEVIK